MKCDIAYCINTSTQRASFMLQCTAEKQCYSAVIPCDIAVTRHSFGGGEGRFRTRGYSVSWTGAIFWGELFQVAKSAGGRWAERGESISWHRHHYIYFRFSLQLYKLFRKSEKWILPPRAWMAMKHGRNSDQCNSCEYYSPKRSKFIYQCYTGI